MLRNFPSNIYASCQLCRLTSLQLDWPLVGCQRIARLHFVNEEDTTATLWLVGCRILIGCVRWVSTIRVSRMTTLCWSMRGTCLLRRRVASRFECLVAERAQYPSMPVFFLFQVFFHGFWLFTRSLCRCFLKNKSPGFLPSILDTLECWLNETVDAILFVIFLYHV